MKPATPHASRYARRLAALWRLSKQEPEQLELPFHAAADSSPSDHETIPRLGAEWWDAAVRAQYRRWGLQPPC